MDDVNLFIKSYWDYFLELEEQFIETKRFVAFDKASIPMISKTKTANKIVNFFLFI